MDLKGNLDLSFKAIYIKTEKNKPTVENRTNRIFN